MQKKLWIVVAALVAAACAAPSTTNRTDTNRNGSAETTATAAPLTEADAIAKEKAVWATFEKKDYNAFADMLDDQAIVVSGEGVNDKPGIVKGIQGFVPKNIVFSDWKFISLDKDAAVLTYKASFSGEANGQTMPAESYYLSSAWVNRNGKWQAIYHQETTVPKTPPPPPPTPDPKAKAAAPSPSATTGTPGTTSSDVEANEKLVWEALKTKNYDAFASYLASEAIEIEPTGVTDKAGSVKGVQGFDLSKAALSEFKTVKFDDDAALVTYVARFPGATPEGERHTTIWANRNGKWVAILHHGTPITPPPASPSPSK